jgi:hypothetical protein
MSHRWKNALLLPLGAENAFFHSDLDALAVRDAKKGQSFEFGFDFASYSFLLTEMLSQGVSGVHIARVDGFDPAAAISSIELPRLKGVDIDHGIADRTKRLLTPFTRALGHEAEHLSPTGTIFTPAAAHATQLSPEQREIWALLCMTFNTAYQLLLASKERSLAAFPLDRGRSALTRLLALNVDPNAARVPAALLAALNTYQNGSVPAIIALDTATSAAGSRWAEEFESLLEDEDYREYCLHKNELGWAQRIDGAMARLTVLSKRLARSGPFRGVVRFGQKYVSVSTGLPVDSIDLGLDSQGRSFLPPIVDVAPAIRRANSAWASTRNGRATRFVIDRFEWIDADFVPERINLHAELGLAWLLTQYTFRPALQAFATAAEIPKATRPLVKDSLERHFQARLGNPTVCSAHHARITLDDVVHRWRWKRDFLEVDINACCEESGRTALFTMLSGG